jgi:group I intron endonuclease
MTGLCKYTNKLQLRDIEIIGDMLGSVYSILGAMGVVYVGSTKCFSMRKANHKRQSIVCTSPLYTFIRDNGGWKAFEMKVVEEIEYTDRKELHLRERFYIEELKPSHNVKVPTRSQKEYYTTPEARKKNRDKNRERYRNNPETREYAKNYYKENKNKIKEQIGEWQEKNRERYLESMRKWRANHPDYMKNYLKKKKDSIL